MAQDQRIIVALAAMIVLAGLGLLMVNSGSTENSAQTDGLNPTVASTPPSPTTTSATTVPVPSLPTDPLDVGEAWLDSIVDNDRATFLALHPPDFTAANETLMMWGFRAGRPLEFGDRYLAGFDAFQAAIDVDDDVVTRQPCRLVADRRVFCGFTATVVGGPETTTTQAVLTVDENGTIVEVRIDAGTSDPTDLFRYWRSFIDDNADERDLACLDIGFNSVVCGIQESNLLRRYVEFYRQRTGS